MSSSTFTASMAQAQQDVALQISLQEQMLRIISDKTSGTFQIASCQNGPRHNCELNINA
jgi:hypothetical protein